MHTRTSFVGAALLPRISSLQPSPVHGRVPQRVSCRATSGSEAGTSSAGSSTRIPGFGPSWSQGGLDARQLTQRLEAFVKLVREGGELVVSTGPRGYTRTIQAAEAVLGLGRELFTGAQRGQQIDAAPAILRKLFERLGPTYIKIGQFVASSPTLFPEEYVLEFQKCLDDAPPVSFDVIRKNIEAELKTPLEDVYESVDQQPLATASIAQVHRAVLKNSGREVVIKVLKPGVEDTLIADLNFLLLGCKVLEFINPQLSRTSLAAIVFDIRASMLEEVDFVKEADHVQEFATYLDTTGMRALATCPFVYRQFSSTRVLVMEYLRGVPLTDLAAIRSVTSVDPERVLIATMNVWFGSLMGAETFHSDLHAGNLLVMRDGRVGFIDFGIVGRIAPVTWKAVEALLTAAATNDYDTMARAMLTIGATDEEVDLRAFAADLENFFVSLRALDSELVVAANRTGGLDASVLADDTQVNRLLLDIVQIGEKHGIRFPREFGMMLKQLLYFDRYVRILAPSLQVLSDDRINLSQARMNKNGFM